MNQTSCRVRGDVGAGAGRSRARSRCCRGRGRCFSRSGGNLGSALLNLFGYHMRYNFLSQINETVHLRIS